MLLVRWCSMRLRKCLERTASFWNCCCPDLVILHHRAPCKWSLEPVWMRCKLWLLGNNVKPWNWFEQSKCWLLRSTLSVSFRKSDEVCGCICDQGRPGAFATGHFPCRMGGRIFSHTSRMERDNFVSHYQKTCAGISHQWSNITIVHHDQLLHQSIDIALHPNTVLQSGRAPW